ncbi:MAG: twin-arginine translocase subunit TatC [Bdellovibrionia bacterium]
MSQLNSSKMAFFDHLDELRARFMRGLWAFMGGFVVCYLVSDQLLMVLKKPLFDALPPDQQKLYFTGLFENFMTHLKISGYASLFFLSPYFFYELWGFIAPGLYPKERKLVVPFISAATFFFIAGACFAYFVLMPVGFKYFIQYGGPTDVPLLTMDSYYSTCLKLLLLFGVAFELPVLIVLFGYLGLVDAPLLRKQRKSAIIGITVVSALFAPPDAVSMLILGAPLIAMYEAAIWVVQWLGVRRPPEAVAADDGKPPNPFEGRSR